PPPPSGQSQLISQLPSWQLCSQRRPFSQGMLQWKVEPPYSHCDTQPVPEQVKSPSGVPGSSGLSSPSLQVVVPSSLVVHSIDEVVRSSVCTLQAAASKLVVMASRRAQGRIRVSWSG